MDLKYLTRLAGALLLMHLLPSAALEFQVHDNNSMTLNAVLATGTIELDDMEKLHQYLGERTKKPNTAIYFDSPGGSLGGGIRLGEYFRRSRIKTVVEGGKTCASACALAFLGGTDAKGNRWMSTTTTSRLGFHAFRNADGSRNSDTDQTQQVVAQVLEYGHFVNAPTEIFIKNFNTPANDMYWFSTQESLDLGIKVWDIKNNCFVGESGCDGLSSPIPAKTDQPSPNHDAPLDFIRSYFFKIKKVPYPETWEMLSASLRTKTGFESYVDWWDKQVDKFSLDYAMALGANTVRAKLSYEMKNGKKVCSIDTLTVQFERGVWVVDEQQHQNCIKKR